MSANLGTLDLPVRRISWRAVSLAVLSAILLGAGVFAITQHKGSSIVSKEPQASVIQTGGMENPSLYAPPQEAAPNAGMENPSLYAPPQEAAPNAGMENPSLYVPRAAFQLADPFPCRVGKIQPC